MEIATCVPSMKLRNRDFVGSWPQALSFSTSVSEALEDFSAGHNPNKIPLTRYRNFVWVMAGTEVFQSFAYGRAERQRLRPASDEVSVAELHARNASRDFHSFSNQRRTAVARLAQISS